MGIYKRRLPDSYQEVTYIQSSGTQWLDTGTSANASTIVEAKWNLVQYNTNINYDKMYGAYGSNDSNTFFMQSNRPDNNKFRVVNYVNTSNRKYVDSTSNLVIGQDYTTIHSNTEFYVNGVLQGTCAATSYTSAYSIGIFAIKTGSSAASQNVYMKLYYFKIYTGTTLKNYLIPCYRKSDGVIGMYDVIKGSFLTNKGTGTFTKGADVAVGPVREVYLCPGDPTSKRGPCPVGYHVSTYGDLNSFYNAFNAWGLGGDSKGPNFAKYFKMPMAGYRSSTAGTVASQGTYCYYWECDGFAVDNGTRLAWGYGTSSSSNPSNYYTHAATGGSIRPFKDVAVEPTSSWTTIYDAGGGDGIFRSSGDGLISVRRNGILVGTMADKNLGATTVWNDGNALSAANCGNYYQRGNNYGFPRTGSVTTSSTIVDASAYGPGEYTSSTFILGSSTNGSIIGSYYNWDKSNNKSLWGACRNMKVYKGSTQVRPEKRKPGSNTYAYYPLTSNANDASGNNRHLTAASAITYSVNGAFLPNSAHTGMVSPFQVTSSGTWTFAWWQNTIGIRDSDARGIDIYWGSTSTNRRLITAWSSNTQKFWSGSSSSYQFASPTETADGWYFNVVTLNSGTLKAYVNGEYIGSGSVATGYTSSYFRWGQEYNNGANRQLYGYMKDIIVENKVWTPIEVKDVYDMMKSDYFSDFLPSSTTIAYRPLSRDFDDYSGHGYNLTKYGTVNLGNRNGLTAACFDAAGYLKSSNITLSNFTMIYWCCLTDKSNTYYIVSNGAYTPKSWLYSGNGKVTRQYPVSSTSSSASNMGSPTEGQWFMMAKTKTGSTYNHYLYLSDTPTVQTPSNGYDVTVTNAVYLGADSSGGSKTNGAVSRVIIENYARTQAQLTGLYRRIKAKYNLS